MRLAGLIAVLLLAGSASALQSSASGVRDLLGVPLPGAAPAAAGVNVTLPGAQSDGGASTKPAPTGVSPAVGATGAGAAAAAGAPGAAGTASSGSLVPPGPAVTGAFVRTSADRLEFHARSLPLADAFAELRRLMRRNIVVAPDVTATFTGDLYDMTVEEIIGALCHSTGLVTREEGAFIYIEPDKAETRVFTLGHARAEDTIALIRPLLSPSGQVTATPSSRQGIASSQNEAGGDDYAAADLIVVRDLRSRLDEIATVLLSFDAEPQQVLIEATILLVSLSDSKQLGVEVSALIGTNFADNGASSISGQGINYGGFDGQQLDDGLGAVATGLNSLIPKANGGLNVGIIKDGVAVFIKALQTQTDATVLANPRIVTMNKQRGEVLLGRRDGFLTTTVTQTSTTQSVEYLETGTRLIFRPFITGTDLVRLEVHPEDSTGGVNSEGLPFKDTAEVTTNIMIRDGETVVIGGLFRERKDVIERKVPLLGDIPLLGALFRSEDSTNRHEEVIIVLTPHIVNMKDGKLRAESTALMQSGSPALASLAASAGWTPLPAPDATATEWHEPVAPAGSFDASGAMTGLDSAGSAGNAGNAGEAGEVGAAGVSGMQTAAGATLPAAARVPSGAAPAGGTPRHAALNLLAEPRLAEVHLALARSLVARGDVGTAAMLLADLDAAHRDNEEVRLLERQIGARSLPLPDVSAVDRQLLDLIAGGLNSR